MSQPFASGFLWLKISGFFWGFIFLFSRDVRTHLKKIKIDALNNLFSGKKFALFILTAVFIAKLALGGIANIFQNLAISLASVEKIAVIKALEGSQYLFILIFAFVITKKYPHILKEEIKLKILSQKLAGIIIIIEGKLF